MENTNINQTVKCPLCRNSAPIMHFGKGYVAVCFTCHKIVFKSETLLLIPTEVETNEIND